jgi:hypothetical protein
MGPEAAKRRTSAQEQHLGVGLRTACLEVIHDCIADLLS